MVKTLVTFAVDAELAPWRRLCQLQEIRCGDITLLQTQIGRAQVDFVVTGMGMENALRVSEAVMERPHQFCIAAGFAGSLNEKYSVGAVLVADAVQQLGTTRTLPCDRDLVTAAWADGAERVKRFLTVDHIVRTAEEKRQLAPFADAVDMESFASLSAAKNRRLPAVAIRVISDSLTSELPAFVDTMVDREGRARVGSVLRNVALHPQHVPALVRLGRDSRNAAEALAYFLQAFIKKLSFSSQGWPPPELQDVAAR
jgi:nucleoside phosphorylase